LQDSHEVYSSAHLSHSGFSAPPPDTPTATTWAAQFTGSCSDPAQFPGQAYPLSIQSTWPQTVLHTPNSLPTALNRDHQYTNSAPFQRTGECHSFHNRPSRSGSNVHDHNGLFLVESGHDISVSGDQLQCHELHCSKLPSISGKSYLPPLCTLQATPPWDDFEHFPSHHTLTHAPTSHNSLACHPWDLQQNPHSQIPEHALDGLGVSIACCSTQAIGPAQHSAINAAHSLPTPNDWPSPTYAGGEWQQCCISSSTRFGGDRGNTFARGGTMATDGLSLEACLQAPLPPTMHHKPFSQSSNQHSLFPGSCATPSHVPLARGHQHGSHGGEAVASLGKESAHTQLRPHTRSRQITLQLPPSEEQRQVLEQQWHDTMAQCWKEQACLKRSTYEVRTAVGHSGGPARLRTCARRTASPRESAGGGDSLLCMRGRELPGGQCIETAWLKAQLHEINGDGSQTLAAGACTEDARQETVRVNEQTAQQRLMGLPCATQGHPGSEGTLQNGSTRHVSNPQRTSHLLCQHMHQESGQQCLQGSLQLNSNRQACEQGQEQHLQLQQRKSARTLEELLAIVEVPQTSQNIETAMAVQLEREPHQQPQGLRVTRPIQVRTSLPAVQVPAVQMAPVATVVMATALPNRTTEFRCFLRASCMDALHQR
jgi:hypothetical protein